MKTESERNVERHSYLFVGSRIYVLGAGMFGTITRITKNGEVWVRVKSRWGNHHHAATCKTFRYASDLIAPEVCGDADIDRIKARAALKLAGKEGE